MQQGFSSMAMFIELYTIDILDEDILSSISLSVGSVALSMGGTHG
jgi:hypothetical protein